MRIANSNLERFIHASIYASRADAGAVIHSHSDEILPFSISDLPLQAVFHSASLIGAEPVPVWDTRTEFGDTNLLVESPAMGDSLSRKLQDRSLVLMRGHGFAATGKTLINAVKLATALPRNARALLDVMQAGGKVTPLSPGEVAKTRRSRYGNARSPAAVGVLVPAAGRALSTRRLLGVLGSRYFSSGSRTLGYVAISVFWYFPSTLSTRRM